MKREKSKVEALIKEYENVESEFFEIDEENKSARIKFEFSKPSDVFDKNYNSKKPILSDEFFSFITSAYEIVPEKYKIDIDVFFDDLEDYTTEQLDDIFKKNLFLEFKTKRTRTKKRNKIAYSLIGVGTFLFLAMILVNSLWKGSSIFKEIFSYVSDIATTVTYWEAMTILVVQKREDNGYRNDFIKRTHSINFFKKS